MSIEFNNNLNQWVYCEYDEDTLERIEQPVHELENTYRYNEDIFQYNNYIRELLSELGLNEDTISIIHEYREPSIIWRISFIIVLELYMDESEKEVLWDDLQEGILTCLPYDLIDPSTLPDHRNITIGEDSLYFTYYTMNSVDIDEIEQCFDKFTIDTGLSDFINRNLITYEIS